MPRRGLVVLQRPPADRDHPGVGDPQPDHARAGRGLATADQARDRRAGRHGRDQRRGAAPLTGNGRRAPDGSSTGACTRRGRRRRSRSRRPAGSRRRSASRRARCAGYERRTLRTSGASSERRGQPRDGQAPGAQAGHAPDAGDGHAAVPGAPGRRTDVLGAAARGATPGAAARAAALRVGRPGGADPGYPATGRQGPAQPAKAPLPLSPRRRRGGRRGVARATARACRADRLRRLHSPPVSTASRARRRSSGWRRGPDAKAASTPSTTRGGCGSTSTSRASCRRCGHCWPSAPVTY